MDAASSPPSPVIPDPAGIRRSFRLGVWNGALYMMGEGFVDASAVVPVFLARLGASGALIGFGSSLSDLGWFLPQVAVVPISAHRPLQMPLYRAAAVFRSGSLALMALALLLLHGHPAAILAAFLLLYGTFCFGAGFAGIAFMEIVGKTVPAEQGGRLFAQRVLWGGALVAVAGIVVRELLRGAPGPEAFAPIFGCAAVFTAISFVVFGRIREPAVAQPAPARTFGSIAREAVASVRREPVYGKLLLSRAALALWTSCAPFVVLLAARDLGGGPRAAGTFLLSRMAGQVLSNLGWQSLAKRSGTPAVMRGATLLAGTGAALAAVVAALSPIGAGWLGATASVNLLVGLAALGGAAQSGTVMSYSSLMLELAPEGDRPMFVGLLNTVLALTMLLPPLAGALVDRIGAPWVFALYALLAVPCHLAARGLPQPGSGRGALARRSAAGA